MSKCTIQVLGARAAGKTSLVRRFCQNIFDDTPAFEEVSDTDNIEHAGDPANYYPAANAFILLFSVESVKSAEHLAKSYDTVHQYKSASAIEVVVAAKCDSSAQEPNALEVGAEFARTHSLPFFRTSSLNNEGVNDVFEQVARLLYKPAHEAEVTRQSMDETRPQVQGKKAGKSGKASKSGKAGKSCLVS